MWVHDDAIAPVITLRLLESYVPAKENGFVSMLAVSVLANCEEPQLRVWWCAVGFLLLLGRVFEERSEFRSLCDNPRLMLSSLIHKIYSCSQVHVDFKKRAHREIRHLGWIPSKPLDKDS